MNGTVDEQELLTEVPPVLKRLCKIVVRGFYESEHAALVTLLTNSKYPCLKEDDLIRLLGFDRKQLRQTLVRLKNDKLIKQRTHKEKNIETGTTSSFNYYFINYKLFVNVVKYKLDHVRKKIESEEKQSKNRPSFVCVQCSNKYSDLEVDRLLDMETGQLKCTLCEGLVEEDSAHIKQSNTSRTSLACFNEQMEPIFRLLRECENMNLAPAVLEPEPQPAQMLGGVHGSHSSAGHHSSKQGWATKTAGYDIHEPGIKISMGPEDEDDSGTSKARAKEAPIWMKQSTVLPASSALNDASAGADPHLTAGSTNRILGGSSKDDEIWQLLVHESVSKKPRLDVNEALGEGIRDEDSDSSDESDFETPAAVGKESGIKDSMEIHSESEQEDDDGNEIKIRIGDKMVSIQDVTDEMMSQMTTGEHDAYTKALQQVYSAYY